MHPNRLPEALDTSEVHGFRFNFDSRPSRKDFSANNVLVFDASLVVRFTQVLVCQRKVVNGEEM